MPVTRRLTRLITSLALVLAGAAFLVVLAAQASGRYRFVPVLSGSMAPFVETGDVAILEPRSSREVVAGDVIAFQPPLPGSSLTLHRVVEVVSATPLTVRTQGDANQAQDPWTAELQGDVVWRATGHIDALGTPVVWVNQPNNRFALMALAAALIGGFAILRVWRDPSAADESPDVVDDEPEIEVLSSEGRPRIAVVALAGLLVAVALIVAGRVEGVSATFVDSATGRQAIATARVAPPTELVATIGCSGATPSSADLVWTASVEAVDTYEIYQGALIGGPYDTLVGTVRGSVTSYSVDLTAQPASKSLSYVVRATRGSWTSADSNEATVTPICAPIDATVETPIDLLAFGL